MLFVTPRGGYGSATELERFREQVNRLLERGRTAEPPVGDSWHPRANVLESAEELRVRVPMPGIDPERLTVSVEAGELRVEAVREPAVPKDARPVRLERVTGRFARSVELPAAVDAQAIRAEYRDGVLTVVLPKTPDAKPRRIQVRSE